MTVENKLWSFIVFSFIFFIYLGYPKFALFYAMGNELFWEDEEEEEEIETEENLYEEEFNELDLQDIPLFFVPIFMYHPSCGFKIFKSNSCFERILKFDLFDDIIYEDEG